jgi:hypothetical protein
MKGNEGEEYLQMYPTRTARWLNQCVACQRKGYKPDMPNEIYPGGALASNLRRYFEPLELDEAGLCDQCRDLVQQ